MEVYLLKSLLDDALNESNENIRIGMFACFSEDYNEIVFVLKRLLVKKELQFFSNSICKITRLNKKLFIEDAYGDKYAITIDEIQFFVDLWDKVQLLDIKTIRI